MADLVCLVCTHDIPTTTLDQILTTAYDHSAKLDGSPRLLLLSDLPGSELRDYKIATLPPIDLSYKSPFVGWTIEQIGVYMVEHGDDRNVNRHLFVVADERTLSDQTLLLVSVLGGDEGNRLETARVSQKWINSEAICVAVGVMDVAGLNAAANADGVYHPLPNESKPPPKKGGAAPRKKMCG